MADKTKSRLPINWFVVALILSLYVLGYFLYPIYPNGAVTLEYGR